MLNKFKNFCQLLNFYKKGNKSSIVLFLSGPSGVGKTTIEHELLDHRNLDIYKVKSTTTRSPRNNPFEDQFYNFISVKSFEKHLKKGTFLFHMKSNYADKVYYGFTNASMLRAIRRGKVVLLNAHASAMEPIKEKLACENVKFVSVFLLPPSTKELKRRIESRNTETKAEIKRRLDNAVSELKYSKYYDYQIINDNSITVGNIIAHIINENLNEVNGKGSHSETKKNKKKKSKFVNHKLGAVKKTMKLKKTDKDISKSKKSSKTKTAKNNKTNKKAKK